MSTNRPHLRAVGSAEPKLHISSSPRPDARLVLLHEVERLIAKARQLNLPNSVSLLNIVHLDLKTKIYRISDEELRAVADAARSLIEP